MKSWQLAAVVVVMGLLGLAQITFFVLRVVTYAPYTSYTPRAAQQDVEIEYVHQAERCLQRGQAKEALEQLTHTKVLLTYRGCYITLIRCAAHCMLEGNCDPVIGAMEQGDFTTMIHDCPDLHDKLLSYCEATKRYRGPGEAAKLIEAALYMDLWISPCCDLQLAHAQYSYEGGDTRGAANLCQRLWDDGKENRWNWNYVEDDRAFRMKLQALRDKVGEGNEQWLKGREIKPFPQGYTIYLQPLGSIGSNTVQGVRERIVDFFGATTTVLPPLPLTHRERYYEMKRKRYNADRLRTEKGKRVQIPDDAFAVVMITEEQMGSSFHGWLYSTSEANLHLISSYPWSSWSQRWQVVTIGNAAIADIVDQLNIRGLYPCISCSSGNTDAKRRVRFGLSPEVQDHYRACDLEAAGRKAVEDLRKQGVPVSSARHEGEESAKRAEVKDGEESH